MPITSLDRFLLLYAMLTSLTVVVLSIFQETQVDVYVALFALEYFVASELTSPFSHEAGRRKTIMTLVMLGIFSAIVVQGILRSFTG